MPSIARLLDSGYLAKVRNISRLATVKRVGPRSRIWLTTIATVRPSHASRLAETSSSSLTMKTGIAMSLRFGH
jgi:hypothetical protein